MAVEVAKVEPKTVPDASGVEALVANVDVGRARGTA
jgi:hypothetical protein